MSMNAVSPVDEKFLTFQVREQSYGIPTKIVREVILYSTFTPILQMPDFIRGLTAIRDEHIPVVDMSLLLGGDENIEPHEKSCYIVVYLKQDKVQIPVCLLVTQINQAYKFPEQDYNPPPIIADRPQAPYLLGLARLPSADNCMLLDFQQLMSPYIPLIRGTDSTVDETTIETNQQVTKLHQTYQQDPKEKIISIGAGPYTFAIPSAPVQNIEQVDYEKFSGDFPDCIYEAGIFANQTRGIVRLRDLLDAEDDETAVSEQGIAQDNQQAVIMIKVRDTIIGLHIDRIGRAYDVAKSELGNSQFCEEFQRHRISSLGFVETEEGKLEIIDPTALFSDKEISEIQSWNGCMDRLQKVSKEDDPYKTAAHQVQSDESPYARYAGSYLLFSLGEEILGIPNKMIKEVTQFESIIELPNTPKDFIGLLDLRGDAYPIIDLCARLSIDDIQSDEHQPCVVLIEHANKTIGLLVHHIIDCRRIEAAVIKGNNKGRLKVDPDSLDAVVPSEQGPIHLINLHEILTREEVSIEKLLDDIKATESSSNGSSSTISDNTSSPSSDSSSPTDMSL